MTTSQRAVDVARDYFQAWTSGDMDRAMTCIAPEAVCLAPAGRLVGAPEVRAFMEPFSRMLITADLVAAFGDREHAVLFYDTRTTLVEHGPGAEYYRVHAGLIQEIRIVFDRLPFEQARAARANA